MTTLNIGDIVRVVISFASPGASTAQNVFYFEVQDASADGPTALTDVNDWFVANYLAEWATISDASCEAFLLEMDVLNGDGTVAFNVGDEDPDVVGTGAADILPAAVSGYLQANSERVTSLGRKYVPFITESQQTDGFLSSFATDALADMIVDWVTPIVIDTVSTLVPGILSRVTQTFQEFLGSGFTTNVPAYQRRRKPNVGS